MAVCSKSDLIADAMANGFTGNVPEKWEALVLQLLCNLGMTCDKTTLLADARSNGFTGNEPDKWRALVLQLLCDIFNGGGGGGTFKQQVFYNAGDPNGVVNVPHDLPAMCVDTTNHIVWTREGGAPGNTGWDSP